MEQDNKKKPPIDSVLFLKDETEVRRSQWQPVVFEYIDTVMANTPVNLPRLVSQNPGLYFAIKNEEAKLDEFKTHTGVKMFELMDTVSEWRRLMLRASFETEFKVHEQP